MPVNFCRICGNDLFKEPLLVYENMPKAAQFLPDAKSLENDKGVDLEIFQCSGCGLVQLRNDPVPYYREVIRAAAVSKEMREFRIRQFSDLIEKYLLRGKKIIEIGCGRGEFLSLMQQSGVMAYGLEYSEESVAACLKNGLRVDRGFIENSNEVLNDAPFDAFYILNYLEHLPDPNSSLRGIYNNLGIEGIGLIEVPNFDMIFQKQLFSEFTIDHLFYFTRETLISTLIKNGFEIIECNEIWYDYVISAVVRKRKRLDISHFTAYQSRLKNEIRKYLESFKDRKVAIWGAGHQALAVISLLDLTDRIKYVVDSASFKQGRYTPVTHIPIVHPDTLDSDPVEAIIIMAASYSDEVADILRRRFEKGINIAVLRDYGLEEA